MKGLTKLLRAMLFGERITVTGTARPDIHRIATRVGIKVKVEKFVGGFYVTRVDGEPVEQEVAELTDEPLVDEEFDFGS